MASVLTGLVRASMTGLFGAAGTAADTITIGGQAYALATTPTTTANEVKVGASAAATCTNLCAAINKSTGGGSLYGSLTVQNPYVTAVDGGDGSLTIKARTAGVIGNAVVLSEAGTGFAWTGAATRLAAGAGQFEELLDTQLTKLKNTTQLDSQQLPIIDGIIADSAL